MPLPASLPPRQQHWPLHGPQCVPRPPPRVRAKGKVRTKGRSKGRSKGKGKGKRRVVRPIASAASVSSTTYATDEEDGSGGSSASLPTAFRTAMGGDARRRRLSSATGSPVPESTDEDGTGDEDEQDIVLHSPRGMD